MKKLLFKPVLCLLLICLLLCGCGSAALPMSLISKSPALALTGEYPYELPAVQNTTWAAAVNADIAAALTPVTDALRLANCSRQVACTEYELCTNSDGSLRIDVYLSSTASAGRILLTAVNISGQGEVSIAEYVIEDYMTDGDWLNGCLRLSGLGLDFTLSGSPAVLMPADICCLLVDYYEAVTGFEVDTSRVSISTESDYLLKALALELCYESDFYLSDSSGVGISQHASMLQTLLSRLFTDWLGRSSCSISQEELLSATELFFRLYFCSGVSPHSEMPELSGSDIPAPANEFQLDRQETALAFNAIYQHCFGALRPPEEPFFYDFSTEALETAFNMDFIDCFPSWALSSFDYHPCEYQLFSLAETFAYACFRDQSDHAAFEVPIDRRMLIVTLGWVDSYLDGYEPPQQKAVLVDNSRNYSWYFTQFNSGDYSDVNCMPTIAAMGIKWYHADSPVTPGELRELWLPESDSGWYMSQVADSLDHYGVPYQWHDLSESITEQLDKGRIILTQMSEAAYDASGHCFVIYGYRRLGDSVQYLIHDPGIYDGLDRHGRRPGESMLLDGAYVEWIIARMTYSYISIG